MILTVVPTYQHIVLLDKREEVVATGGYLTAFLHLCQEPRAGNHSMSFQEFQTRGGTHLAGDNTLQVFLHWQLVDGAYLVSLDHETECAEEGLCLLALPMEVDTDGDITQRE